MNVAVQPYLFRQPGLDSGSLTMLGTAVHRFTKAGSYRGVSVRNGVRDAVFYVTVVDGDAVNQVDIDLASLSLDRRPAGCDCAPDGGRRFVLATHGYAVFHVSGGAGGFAVHVGRAATEPQAREFDSERLAGGDMFAATVLRPGRYSVAEVVRGGPGAKAELDVAYPAASKTAYQPPGVVRVAVTERGFEPAAVRMTAFQACLFTCAAPARIKIALVRPYDAPDGA